MDSYIQSLKKFEHWNTDLGTDKNTSHSYGNVYDQLFKQFKDSPINILEIGISGGYGLLSYVDYFPNAQVYGLDIKDICNPTSKQHERIHLQFGNALDSQVVQSYSQQFHLIIEDASHYPQDQVQHFSDFAPKLEKGGYYIIEDIDGKYLEFVKEHVEKKVSELGYTMQILDLRPEKKRFDDILILVKRP